jgi:acyl carrier protein
MVHIQDKAALFSNIATHLNEQGYLIVADFVANTRTEMEDNELGTYTPTKSQWAALFSEHHLQLQACVDVSREIANFLYDPDFAQNQQVKAEFYANPLTRRYHEMYNNLHVSLSEGLVSYVLMVARKVEQRSPNELTTANHHQFLSPTLYAQLLRNHPALVVDSQGIFRGSGLIQQDEQQTAQDPTAPMAAQKKAISPVSTPNGDKALRGLHRNGDLVHAISQIVQEEVRTVLKFDSSEVDGSMSFEELGVDSINAVRIIEAINTRFDLYLKPTLLYSYPSLAELSRHIAAEHGEEVSNKVHRQPEMVPDTDEIQSAVPGDEKAVDLSILISQLEQLSLEEIEALTDEVEGL